MTVNGKRADAEQVQREMDRLDRLVAVQAAEIERLRSFEAANKMNSAQVAAQRLVVENQNAEIERLRAALREIAELNVPRPVGHTFRDDGTPSKHDKCLHGETMYDECAPCMAVHARAALEERT